MGEKAFIQFARNFVTIDCCVCGMTFAVDSVFEGKLRETHQSFHCPNGHPQSYRGKSEAETLREELAKKEREATTLRWNLTDTEKKLKKITKRVSNGVCPCCNRSFTNLARHMKTKHPEKADKK